MRLLHFEGDRWSDDPLSITLCEYNDASQIPPYMILSHRWRDEEVSFADMLPTGSFGARSKKGYSKIEDSCRIALQLNLSYAWVDTCCIDKSSSAELSEAINSMYEWYAKSSICVAYLDDVEINGRSSEQDHGDTDSSDRYVFEDSEWFKRGWTLQELIAPKEVYFYTKSWRTLGSRSSLRDGLAKVSGIALEVLLNPDRVQKFCIAERMSWAASRHTTRPEDEAYSLLGLFRVSMPPLYGEGQKRAFRRLQIEIMSTAHDHTIFAWDSRKITGDMLAPSVQSFELSDRSGYRKLSYEEYMDAFNMHSPKLDYSMTNIGMHIELPMCPVPYCPGLYYAFLACVPNSTTGVYTAIYVRKRVYRNFAKFCRTTFNGEAVVLLDQLDNFDIGPQTLWISEDDSAGSTTKTTITNRLDLKLKYRTDIYFPTQWESFAHRDSRILHYVPQSFKWARLTVHQATKQSSISVVLQGPKCMILAFGTVDYRLWFWAGSTAEPKDNGLHARHLFDFPAGLAWTTSWSAKRGPIIFLDEVMAPTALPHWNFEYTIPEIPEYKLRATTPVMHLGFVELTIEVRLSDARFSITPGQYDISKTLVNRDHTDIESRDRKIDNQDYLEGSLGY